MSNPFGGAKPREAVLASKGVDYQQLERELDEKAAAASLHVQAGHENQDGRHGQDNGEMYHQQYQQYQNHHQYHQHHQPRRHMYRNYDDQRSHHDYRRPHPHYYNSHYNKTWTTDETSGRGGGSGRLTPSQAIHPPPAKSHYDSYDSPRHHRYSFDKDDNDNHDDCTHETASVTTIHSHLSHHTGSTISSSTCTPHHSSPSENPFGAARPREEVLADRGVDARAIDSKIDQQVLEKEEAVTIRTENLVALNHPREPAKSTNACSSAPARKPKKKVNPFGDAKPREVVLANKGVDYRSVDKRLDRKIAAEHLTPEQEAEAEIIRLALIRAEDAYWDANEKELPEEALRLEMEAKRKELHDLLERFQEINLKKKREDSSSSASTSTSICKAGNQKDQEVLDDEGSSLDRVELDKEEEESNETSRDDAPDEKVEYHFQGRTSEHHDRETSYQERDQSSSYQSRQEYHGGDARRYSNVERPWYANRSRYADGGDEIRSGHHRGGRGGGYYRGGRGRGGRGRRYGSRGDGGSDDRYSRGGYAGYGGHSRSHGRQYDDNNDEYEHRSQRREHWALMD